nr:translation initiation factor IF-2 [Oryctolagus cuniculus]
MSSSGKSARGSEKVMLCRLTTGAIHRSSSQQVLGREGVRWVRGSWVSCHHGETSSSPIRLESRRSSSEGSAPGKVQRPNRQGDGRPRPDHKAPSKPLGQPVNGLAAAVCSPELSRVWLAKLPGEAMPFPVADLSLSGRARGQPGNLRAREGNAAASSPAHGRRPPTRRPSHLPARGHRTARPRQALLAGAPIQGLKGPPPSPHHVNPHGRPTTPSDATRGPPAGSPSGIRVGRPAYLAGGLGRAGQREAAAERTWAGRQVQVVAAATRVAVATVAAQSSSSSAAASCFPLGLPRCQERPNRASASSWSLPGELQPATSAGARPPSRACAPASGPAQALPERSRTCLFPSTQWTLEKPGCVAWKITELSSLPCTDLVIVLGGVYLIALYLQGNQSLKTLTKRVNNHPGFLESKCISRQWDFDYQHQKTLGQTKVIGNTMK